MANMKKKQQTKLRKKYPKGRNGKINRTSKNANANKKELAERRCSYTALDFCYSYC